MPRAELDAFDRHYLDHGLTTTWDGSITMLAGTGVGGGTLVNWMTCIDAPESVRDGWEREHGLEGVTGDAWAADVAAIESELGVAESTHIPPKDAILLRGARALGWEAAPTRRNASACGDCGSCGFGCRRGTKQSGIRVHLADASAAGARIVAGARVTRVLVENGVAVGVEAELTMAGDPATTTPRPPRRLLVHAPTVVLAAGALRTPAILQRSGLEHPAIGRHLRLHPVPVVAGRFDETVEMWRGTLQAARSLEFSEPDAGRNGYVIEAAPGHPGLLALALPWEGAEAHAGVMAGVATCRRSSPSPATAVRVASRLTKTRPRSDRLPARRDRRRDDASRAGVDGAIGSRGGRRRRSSPPGLRRRGSARSAGGSDADARGFAPLRGGAGSLRLRTEPRWRLLGPPDGLGADGCRRARGSLRPVGTRPRRDRDGQAIVGGLYVGDGSVFPTGIGVNPMVTIMAMARRLSRVIQAET